jgi:excisionase family DNA binding protein
MEKIIIITNEDQLNEAVRKAVNNILPPNGNYPPPESSEGSSNLLTVKEAAKLLNLAVPTIYGLVHRRQIPFHKKTKRLYFFKDQIIKWIQSGRSLESDNQAIDKMIEANKKRRARS